MFERLSEVLHPLAEIAKQLRIANELKELELAGRVDRNGNPSPIYRITEKPSRKDTEVFYTGEQSNKRSSDVNEVLANALEEEDD